jgi:hypothetical protein
MTDETLPDPGLASATPAIAAIASAHAPTIDTTIARFLCDLLMVPPFVRCTEHRVGSVLVDRMKDGRVMA